MKATKCVILFILILLIAYIVATKSYLFVISRSSNPLPPSLVKVINDDAMFDRMTDIFTVKQGELYVVSKREVQVFVSAEGHIVGSYCEGSRASLKRKLYTYNISDEKITSVGVIYAAEAGSFNEIRNKLKNSVPFAQVSPKRISRDLVTVYGNKSEDQISTEDNQ